MAEQGSSLRMPSARRKRKNWRMAESFRAREVGARPLRASPARKARRWSGDGVARGLALGGEEGEELGQVARVGLDGVGRGAALGDQHVEEQRKLGRSVAARSFGVGQGSGLSARRPMRVERLEAETPRLGIEPDPLQRAQRIAERDEMGALGAVRPEHRGGDQHGAPDLAGVRGLLQAGERAGRGQIAVSGCGVLLARSQSGIGTS